MYDKRSAVLLFGGGFCLLLILAGVIMDIADGGSSPNSLFFGVLGVVLATGLVMIGLRQGSRR
ncbi:MAG: hypothetical protein ABW215_03225 [Kibdelosporangium sp.]